MITKERIEPITHELKIYPEFFSAVCTGVKRAELRKNDRDYRVGDTLHLLETPRGSCNPTGEYINVIITHIADVGEWITGYVLLSIERETMDSEPVVFTDERNLHHIAMGRETSLIWGKQNQEAGDIPLYRHAQPITDASSEPLAYIFKHPAGRLFWALTDESNKGQSDVIPVYAVPQPAPVVMDERAAFNAWNNDVDCPLAGRDAKSAAWMAWQARAMLKAGTLTNEDAKKAGNSPVIPEGYVMVPKEMTDEIGEAIAMQANCCGGIALDIYDAMLAAAPQEVK